MRNILILGLISMTFGCGSEKNETKGVYPPTVKEQKVIYSGELKPGKVILIPVESSQTSLQRISH